MLSRTAIYTRILFGGAILSAGLLAGVVHPHHSYAIIGGSRNGGVHLLAAGPVPSAAGARRAAPVPRYLSGRI